MSHPHAPAEQAERPTPPVTQHRQPIHASRDGQAVVYLPVASLEWAVLDADDADRLAACGVRLHDAEVITMDYAAQHVAIRAERPGPVPVVLLSRLVTGAAKTHRVLYVNGDRLDLRRENLRLRRRTERLRSPAEASAGGAAQ